ncbi:MAG: EamA family transporter [Patescibacteria group bacterium]
MWIALSLIVAVIDSISVAITKKATKTIDEYAYLLLINIFFLPIAAVYVVFFAGIPGYIPLEFFLIIGLSSIIDVIGFSCAVKGIKRSHISLIGPVSAFYPVFVTIVSYLLLQESPTPLKLGGIGLVVVGSYLLHIQDVRNGIFQPFRELFSHQGVQLYLVSQIIWSVTPIAQKKAILMTVPQVPMFTSLVNFSLITLYLIPLALFHQPLRKVVSSSKGYVPLFILLGLLFFISDLSLYNAFILTNVAYVMSLVKVSVILTIIIGALVFKEERIRERLVGSLVMIAGTVLLVV